MVRKSGGQQAFSKYMILGLDKIEEKQNFIQQAVDSNKEYVRPFGLSNDQFIDPEEKHALEGQYNKKL